ncbi:MAG: LacI family transcriptional regulator [Clostridiales bacterium]|jgi:LacI family transcriptional regulator|nr:LacI family transcriptional regulator [Clostridiales bacterium]
MPTIKDVAKLAGVSTATVSRVLNGENVKEENRRRVEEAVKRLNYSTNTLARALKTNKTMTVGVIVPDLSNVFFTTIAKGIEKALHPYGYSIMVCDSDESIEGEREKIAFLKDKFVDGIIIIPVGDQQPYLKRIQDDGTPIVLVDRFIEDIQADAILVDNINGAYDAVEHLIVNGHRRIGLISGPQHIFVGKERLIGYERAYTDYQLNIDAEIIRYGDLHIESGYKLMNELLDLPSPPTAIFAANYYMSIGAIMAANERHINIPEELSFIGFDDMELTKVIKPPLTVVVQPMDKMGQAAAELIYKRMMRDNSGPFPTILRLKTQLIKRESVKKIN